MKQLLTERFSFSGGKVDRTGKYPVIRGVLLCGPTSMNRRRYKPEAFAGGRVKRYEGRPVFVNHSGGGQSVSRVYQDQLGWIENARLRSDGMPVGDVAVKPTHPLAESVLWDAENRPANCGMSHVANCETRPGADGWDDVVEMVEAESVDLVVGPATTKGLYEGTRMRRFTLRQLAEWAIRHPRCTSKTTARAKRLREVIGGEEDEAYIPEPAADADPNAAIIDGLKTAGHALWDQCVGGKITAAELMKGLRGLLSDVAKYDGGPDEPDPVETEEAIQSGKFADYITERYTPPRGGIPTGGKAFAKWVSE